MKVITPIHVFLIAFLTNGCGHESVNPENYKGGSLHIQPPIEIFPDESIYTFSTITDPLLKNSLAASIQQIISTQEINGISITLLIPNQGMWQLDTGYLSKENNIPVDTSSVFYWASVSKLITSTVIHQIILENQLQSTDKLSNWFPQFEHSELISIQHLLNHTSGIFSFNSDSVFHLNNEFHTPNELIHVALSHNNLFAPGEYWSYSNTGYLLLALIAEKIEGKSFSQIVQERISLPQNLSSMKVLEQQEQPANLALAHHQGHVIATHYSMPLGAGNVVSNSKDMSLFLHSLLTGKYLPESIVHGMLKELYPTFNTGQYYGAGLMLYDFNEINNTQTQWIGHSGGTAHYKAILAYDIKTKTICAVSVNQNTAVEAVAFRMIGITDN